MSDIENFIEKIISNSSTEAMKAIMSLKASDQTYGHCIDVGVLFESLYFNCVEQWKKSSEFSTNKEAMLGAFLHDFGKSKVPKEILDSTARFEYGSYEMDQIRSHPIHGAKLLNGMNMPDVMINMCLYHHVKKDESLKNSYPVKLEYKNSSFGAKLLAIVDIYQALVGQRSYKRSWTPPQTIRYLSALAGIEFDEEIWDLFVGIIGEYPVGSLVVLSDDSIGFVMSVPAKNEDLLRPQIAVVRNSYGEDCENHTLVDLQEERDLSIINDLDAKDVFSQKALYQFSSLKIVA